MLAKESVKMPTHSCVANLSRVMYIATSSARIMVRVSYVPPASMYRVVHVGTYTTAAPRRGWPLISEPSVYTHCSGWYLGIHWSGVRAECRGCLYAWVPLSGSIGVSPRCGRYSRDVFHCCVGAGGPSGSFSAGRVCLRIVDMVLVRVLRSVH